MFVEFILCSRDNLDAGPRLPDVDDDLGFVGQGREPLTLDVLGVAAATSGGPVPGPRALQDGLNLLIRTNKIMSQKSLCWDVVKFSAAYVVKKRMTSGLVMTTRLQVISSTLVMFLPHIPCRMPSGVAREAMLPWRTQMRTRR